ncbi:MAG: hypothetical protein ACR2IF_02205 [Terriglobales bacterium]
MRTFPKSLAAFQNIVNERGERLRKLSFTELNSAAFSTEHIEVESRPATIDVIVQPRPDGSVRVVLQGFLKARLLGKHVALDGFYKHPDGSVSAMPDREFYEFD